MDDQIRRGYARLLRDLQLSERPAHLRTSLEEAKKSIDELERFIVRLEQLENHHKGLDSSGH